MQPDPGTIGVLKQRFLSVLLWAPLLLGGPGCVHHIERPAGTESKAPSPPVAPSAPAQSAPQTTPPAAASAPAPAPPAPSAPSPQTAAAVGAGTAPAATGAPRTGPASQPPPAKPPAAARNPPPASAPSPSSAAPPLGKAAAPAAAPALDLDGLEQRLRDTRAIGVFTKLSLKNQVDDLLGQFKTFHKGQIPPTLPQLRQKYELLLMKVVTLLQDGDPSLAGAVSSSREAIWSVLTDPAKFAKLSA